MCVYGYVETHKRGTQTKLGFGRDDPRVIDSQSLLSCVIPLCVPHSVIKMEIILSTNGIVGKKELMHMELLAYFLDHEVMLVSSKSRKDH